MSSSSMDDEKPFLEDMKERGHYEPVTTMNVRQRYYKNERRVLPWVTATVIFATSTLGLLVYIATAWRYYQPSQFGSFETGFHTDLGMLFKYLHSITLLIEILLEPAKPAIEAKRVQFTGELKFHENGTMYRDWADGEPRYFGPPTPEIDKAWDDLLYASGIDLPEEEAESVKDFTWEEPMGGYWRTG
jgi:hypothetical protein